MIAFLIVYTLISGVIMVYAWGIATLDVRMRDISLLGAFGSIAIGLFWPIVIIAALSWFALAYHTK